MCQLLQTGKSPSQDGQIGSGTGRQLQFREARKPLRVSPQIHTTVYSVTGACMSVQRRKLSLAQLPEDEACGSTHKGLQTQDQRWLSNMQAAHCFVLLPCKALQRKQMPGTFLPAAEAEASAAAAPTTTTSSSDVASANGHYDVRES